MSDITMQLNKPDGRLELGATLIFHTLAAVRWASGPGGVTVKDGEDRYPWGGVVGQSFLCVHGHGVKIVKSAHAAGLDVALIGRRKP